MTSDRRLLEQFLEGNSQDAFRQLVERHIRLIYWAVWRDLHDREAAEDVTQAVFLLLVKKAADVQRTESLAGWLFGAARLAARDATANGATQSANATPANLPTSGWRLKELTLCWQMNIVDHGQRMPDIGGAGAVRKSLSSYVRGLDLGLKINGKPYYPRQYTNSDIVFDQAETAQPFGTNASLTNRLTSSVPNPAWTIVFYEPTPDPAICFVFRRPRQPNYRVRMEGAVERIANSLVGRLTRRSARPYQECCD
jgi:hypothetical protein